jgi:hypothetical protein
MLYGPLKESYQAEMDSLHPLLVVGPCLAIALVAHPKTRHAFAFRVRASAAPRAHTLARSLARRLGPRAPGPGPAQAPAPPQPRAASPISPHSRTRAPALAQVLWAFCVYLEAVSVLPQLRMMQKAKVVEKFTAHYVFALGLSRFISCAHWLLQASRGWAAGARQGRAGGAGQGRPRVARFLLPGSRAAGPRRCGTQGGASWAVRGGAGGWRACLWRAWAG